MVVISPDHNVREQMLRHLIVRIGFAAIPSDAKKIISQDIYSIDLNTAYFVFCTKYSFRVSTLTTQRLYEMAARGIAVAVGVSKLPREVEFICQSFYPEDLLPR